MNNRLLNGNNIELLKTLDNDSVDSIVTDPPYGISFMGNKWDYDVPTIDFWKEVYRVLKPGGHILSFSSSRTYHRMVINIEDAGFEIRDQILWIYGSGFPKSNNIGKAVDKVLGNEREVVGVKHPQYKDGVPGGKGFHNSLGREGGDRLEPEMETKGQSEWEGWGTALKPAHEPICMARKPLAEKSITENVLKYKTGAININDCRVEFINEDDYNEATIKNQHADFGTKPMTNNVVYGDYSMVEPKNYKPTGRYPANIIHDGSDEVVNEFPITKSGYNKSSYKNTRNDDGIINKTFESNDGGYGDVGSASRFFYCPKAGPSERKFDSDNKNTHPTVKPIKLMRYLVRLVTPKNGVVLDPFMGSGTTGVACKADGFDFIGMEMNDDYFDIANKRMNTDYDFSSDDIKIKLDNPIKQNIVKSVTYNNDKYF